MRLIHNIRERICIKTLKANSSNKSSILPPGVIEQHVVVVVDGWATARSSCVSFSQHALLLFLWG